MEKDNNKVFMMIWFGQMIASIGSGLTSFGLNVHVFQQTRSATACSAVILCAFLPMVLLTPFAGIVADRFNRKKLMLIGDGFSAVSLLIMLIFMVGGNNNVVMICIFVFISAIFAALMDPVYKSLVTDLLTPAQFSKASGLIQLASSAKFLIAPAIAGILMKTSGIKVILMIDILTFILTLATIIYAGNSIVNIKDKNKKDNKSYLADLLEGWDWLAKNKGLLVLLLLTTVVTFYIGFVETLLTPMLLALTNSSTLGVIKSFGATGMLVTSIIVGFKGIEKGYIKVLSRAFAIMGILIVVLGSVRNLYMITLTGFLFFAMLPLANISIDVLVRSSLKEETQGRVWGLISFISQLGYIVAYGISGPLADYVFNPLLYKNGLLADSVGKIIGVGQGRGIALMFVICGLSMFILSYIIKINQQIKVLEINYMLQKTGER